MHIYLVHNRHRYKLNELQDTYSKANKLVRFCLFFALLLRTCKHRCACDWVCRCCCMCDWVCLRVCVSEMRSDTVAQSHTWDALNVVHLMLPQSFSYENKPEKKKRKKSKKQISQLVSRLSFVWLFRIYWQFCTVVVVIASLYVFLLGTRKGFVELRFRSKCSSPITTTCTGYITGSIFIYKFHICLLYLSSCHLIVAHI